jgi:hypothetical protein
MPSTHSMPFVLGGMLGIHNGEESDTESMSECQAEAIPQDKKKEASCTLLC